jgi:ribose transport system permease protein
MTETRTVTKKKEKRDVARLIGTLAPYAGLVLIIILFQVLTGGKLLAGSNLKSMINNVIVTSLCAIGAVFVFAAGFFDMSIGASVNFAAVLGAMSTVATGNMMVGLIATLATALVLGLLKGMLAAYVNVPFFIFTIILASIFSALVTVILGESSMILFDDISNIHEIAIIGRDTLTVISFAVVAVFFIFCLILFNYTPIGLKAKNMGGNPVAAKQSGIDTKRSTFVVFLISALGIALAAFLILIRMRTASSGTASTVSNDVMVALVVGGMPLSGGARSKISAGLVGAISITVLNSGLAILGLTAGHIQLFRGFVFIIVVLIASLSYRGKLLPR